jgi:hypothetical protein
MMAKLAKITPRMIETYCTAKVAQVLSPRETELIRRYLVRLLSTKTMPPYKRTWIDCAEVASETEVNVVRLEFAKPQLQPVFDAVRRTVEMSARCKPRHRKDAEKVASNEPLAQVKALCRPDAHRKRRTYPKKPIVEFPNPLWDEWNDPASFADSLTLHIRRHGDSRHHLCRAVSSEDAVLDHHNLRKWCMGESSPQHLQSFHILKRIERRYRLPTGYFMEKLPHLGRASRGHEVGDVGAAEMRRLAWHLPDDFNARSPAEQDEILAWVKRVIINGSTDYRRYQAAALKQRYGLRFKALAPSTRIDLDDVPPQDDDVAVEIAQGIVAAPETLEREMADLLRFKTSTLTAFGQQRNGVWNKETAAQKVEHLGLMFGALAASPKSGVRGAGAVREYLSLALLVFPSVWDWYLQWREQRRGFFTNWEVDMLSVGLALVRQETGWLRQTPQIADHLHPVPGLVTAADIAGARGNWDRACDIMFKHGRNRAKEIQRVARVHRDPFEPILPILEAESPVSEYRKITEEILRLMPDERLYPRPAAEAVRSFLMLRFGLHLGLRQRNLRELLVCPPGHLPSSERYLEDVRRGELRWNTKENGWEVFIPSIAFKNANSSFFGAKPFRLLLPDLGRLYEMIDVYLGRHRERLLGPAADPRTFFVKTAKYNSASAEYDQTTFYEAWRLTVQRYGIYNPYTKRGAIPGLLPHGPHNVRDVLATHILKKTGSYEQASYAIQDTAEMVAKHYGRFLPQDKAAIAAKVLNLAWEAA